MDVPRGRLEIRDYVGGQLCKAVMCQLPAVAMYRGSPPPPSQLPRNSILYCYSETVFLAGCSGRVAPKKHAADFSHEQQKQAEYVSCIGLAVYNGSSHPVGTNWAAPLSVLPLHYLQPCFPIV